MQLSSPAGTVRIRTATPSDLAVVEQLLRDAALPVEGVRDHFGSFLIADSAGRAVGTIGLERYDRYGLLRSAVVHPDYRGAGIGELLTEGLLQRARIAGLSSLYLLTTTAQHYFPRFGFLQTSRSDVPIELQESVEFRGACPDTAVIMRMDLK